VGASALQPGGIICTPEGLNVSSTGFRRWRVDLRFMEGSRESDDTILLNLKFSGVKRAEE
jgi:hypothetical protein